MNNSAKSSKKLGKTSWIYSKPKVAYATLLLSAIVFAVLNGQWLVAQLRYRSTPSVQATASDIGTVSKFDPSAPAIINIPVINVNAPIILDEPSSQDANVQLALRRGVLLYGNSTRPGKKGHTIIVGHSSGQLWSPGDYKWVFTLLEKLKPGDKIHVSYQGIAYTYTVKDSIIVSPSDAKVLAPTTESVLSLVTCTPVGTNQNRLVVRASLDTIPMPITDY
ncbi:sortase [Candidatus Saccharibacteria bacterium]|nr:sortase [Candidatus Saccharibacteria bacterium]